MRGLLPTRLDFLSVFGAAWTLCHLAVVACASSCQPYGDALSACRCLHSPQGLAIDCSRIGLLGIPTAIPYTADLVNLSGNSITAVKSGAFGQFENLTTLDLSQNSIKRMQNDSLSGLRALRYLNLSGNPISYSNVCDSHTPICCATGYDAGSLNSLERLETLGIQTDPCPDRYPDHILLAGLGSLRELAMNFPLSGPFGDAMGNLTSLDTLYVSNACRRKRKLTRDDVQTLQRTQLRRLSLRNANLHHIDPHALSVLNATLRKLDISCNSIDNVADVIIGLAGTKLETLLADSSVGNFVALRLSRRMLEAILKMNLTVLSLANNLLLGVELSNASESILKPTGLKYLRIGYNQIMLHPDKGSATIDLLFSWIPLIFNLRVLDISGLLDFYLYKELTKCAEEDALFADGEKYWERDSINNDTAPEMPLWLWSLLAVLRYDNLKLVTLPPQLTRIYSRNAGALFRSLVCKKTYNYSAYLNNLHIIDATGIHVLEIDCHIAGFNALESVYASQMRLEKYNPSLFSFNAAPSLKWLDLSFNKLGPFLGDDSLNPLENMSQINHLDLSFNGINRLRQNMFEQCGSLKTLNLAGNNLRDWQVSVSGLKKLETLVLSGNALASIEKPYLDQFDELHEQGSLKKIYLGNVTCACSFTFLAWLLRTGVLLPDFSCSDSSILSAVATSPAPEHVLIACVAVYAVSAACAALAVSLIALRFKWRLKYIYYKLRQRIACRRGPQCRASDVMLYLAYDESDCERARLVHQFLTERMAFRSVVSRRSFLVGSDEYDQMVLHIDRSHFVVLLVSAHTVKNPKSEFELHMSLEKGTRYVVPILVADVKSYDELPRVLKKLLLMNNHLLWPPAAAAGADRVAESEQFFAFLEGCVQNLVRRLSLSRERQPAVTRLPGSLSSLEELLDTRDG